MSKNHLSAKKANNRDATIYCKKLRDLAYKTILVLKCVLKFNCKLKLLYGTN